MDFTWVLTELAIIVLSIIYIVMRAALLGHDFVNNSKRAKTLTVLAIIALSLTIGISNGIKNYSLYSNIYTGIFDVYFITVVIITFISAAVSISVIFALLYWLNSKGQQRIERKLNEEDKQD